jgi:hypothetical protein
MVAEPKTDASNPSFSFDHTKIEKQIDYLRRSKELALDAAIKQSACPSTAKDLIEKAETIHQWLIK